MTWCGQSRRRRDPGTARCPGADCDPADRLSKGADSLAALSKETLAQDPFSGAVLVYRSRDRVKILVWDGTGLVLVWKRLERGAFKWPPITNGVMRLSPAQLAALIEGLDWSRVHVPRIARPQARR